MKLGLALSGGGIRGAAHAGVLQGLEELGIRVDLVSGASAGAMAAALYASGFSPEELERFALAQNSSILDYDTAGILKSLARRVFGKPPLVTGLIKGDKIAAELRAVTGNISLNQCRIPVAVSAVDLISGRTVFFVSDRRGLNDSECELYFAGVSLADAVAASIAIPMAFASRSMFGCQLVDGGLLENLPVEVLYRMGADRVIGVDLGKDPCRCPVYGIPEVGEESLRVLSRRVLELRTQDISCLLTPELGDTGSFDFKAIPFCIRKGYECAMEHSRDLLKAARFSCK